LELLMSFLKVPTSHQCGSSTKKPWVTEVVGGAQGQKRGHPGADATQPHFHDSGFSSSPDHREFSATTSYLSPMPPTPPALGAPSWL
jgi:hypothetical protein